MKTRSFIAPALVIILILAANSTAAQDGWSFRTYGKVGLLLTPPTTEELDYGSDNLDDIHDMNALNYGFGIQVLREREGSFSLGGEVGLQSLFSSVIHFGWPGGGYDDSWDREWDIYVSPLIEFPSANSDVFFQCGPGLHVVIWHYLSQRSGYSNVGVGVNFGLHGSVGYDMKLNERLSIPIAFRTDLMIRYGVMLQAGLTIGINNRR